MNQQTINVGGVAFVIVQDNDGNVVELQVPVLGNGYAPYTIGFNPGVLVGTAATIAQALVDAAHS